MMSDYRLLAMGLEPSKAKAVAILAHGRGGSPEDMARLAAALDVPDVAYLLPGAPGNTWYPQSFMAPYDLNEPWLSRSLANQAELIDGLIAIGIPPGRIVLGGFSQGACLTAETLVRAPRRYGAAIILTGGLIGPPGTAWSVQPALAGTPVFLTGSETDPHVPPSRARETERVLRESGALVETRIVADRPHMVTPEEIATARSYLRAVAETPPA
ncbi:MAG TPA: alpha/beta fold hydrolase [Bauldia sp.]|nr:alpha/beta fold hydrolase [Bauldia sp.]